LSVEIEHVGGRAESGLEGFPSGDVEEGEDGFG